MASSCNENANLAGAPNADASNVEAGNAAEERLAAVRAVLDARTQQLTDVQLRLQESSLKLARREIEAEELRARAQHVEGSFRALEDLLTLVKQRMPDALQELGKLGNNAQSIPGGPAMSPTTTASNPAGTSASHSIPTGQSSSPKPTVSDLNSSPNGDLSSNHGLQSLTPGTPGCPLQRRQDASTNIVLGDTMRQLLGDSVQLPVWNRAPAPDIYQQRDPQLRCLVPQVLPRAPMPHLQQAVSEVSPGQMKRCSSAPGVGTASGTAKQKGPTAKVLGQTAANGRNLFGAAAEGLEDSRGVEVLLTSNSASRNCTRVQPRPSSVSSTVRRQSPSLPIATPFCSHVPARPISPVRRMHLEAPIPLFTPALRVQGGRSLSPGRPVAAARPVSATRVGYPVWLQR